MNQILYVLITVILLLLILRVNNNSIYRKITDAKLDSDSSFRQENLRIDGVSQRLETRIDELTQRVSKLEETTKKWSGK